MSTVLTKDFWHVLRQLSPGLWQIEFLWPTSTNCWIWQEVDGLTLIDAGMPHNAKAILEAVCKIGRPLRRIIITHAHPDHAGAAAELSSATGAQVFASSAEIPFLQGKCMSEVPGFWMCKTVLKTGEHLGILRPPSIHHVVPVSDGEMIGTLKVLHSPGHTPGSIALWGDSASALFCGDNICTSYSQMHIGLPWFTLDLKTQRESIARYHEVPAKLLLPGHGTAYFGEIVSRLRSLLR